MKNNYIKNLGIGICSILIINGFNTQTVEAKNNDQNQIEINSVDSSKKLLNFPMGMKIMNMMLKMKH